MSVSEPRLDIKTFCFYQMVSYSGCGDASVSQRFLKCSNCVTFVNSIPRSRSISLIFISDFYLDFQVKMKGLWATRSC